MSKPMKEQIEKLKALSDWDWHITPGAREGLRTLLDAYEERGQEIERLRAAADAQHSLILAQDRDRAVLRERAEQAEAGLARVVEQLKDVISHSMINRERLAAIALDALDALAAAKEEKP